MPTPIINDALTDISGSPWRAQCNSRDVARVASADPEHTIT